MVARHGDQIVGFAGIWLMVDEAHITTFAVRKTWRRQGVGERLLIALLALAEARGGREATLEVRPSNHPAGACTRSTASRWSASGRATTATTTRTP
jgi:ribosomal-protein-alanine N-acetyltransferase